MKWMGKGISRQRRGCTVFMGRNDEGEVVWQLGSRSRDTTMGDQALLALSQSIQYGMLAVALHTLCDSCPMQRGALLRLTCALSACQLTIRCLIITSRLERVAQTEDGKTGCMGLMSQPIGSGGAVVIFVDSEHPSQLE